MRVRVRSRRQDVSDLKIIDGQPVGNHPPVAAPPGQLGAHHGHSSLPSLILQPPDALLEWRRLHVIRVAAKGWVLPGRVGRARRDLAPAAEQWVVLILDATIGQERLERLGVELRVPARARNAARIRQHGHAESCQQLRQLIRRPGAVSNGIHNRRHARKIAGAAILDVLDVHSFR